MIDVRHLKEELERHISECEGLLELLEEDEIPLEYRRALEKIAALIEYKNSQSVMSDSDNTKFIELMNSIPSVAIQGYNKNREVVYWNKASEDIYGYTVTEAMGNRIESLIIPQEMSDVVVSHITDWYENGKVIPAGELVLERKDKTPVHVFSSHVMLGESTGRTEMFCVDVDLSEIARLRHEKKKLEKKANVDKLTGAFNRQYLESVIGLKFREMRTAGKKISLIMLDIDFFKKINDTYGHDVGDVSLSVLSRIVHESIRKEDMFVRWGGEEFMLLVESGMEQANSIANKLRENIAVCTADSNETPAFTCSFGVVDLSDYDSFEDAYKAADGKLYLAKGNGGGTGWSADRALKNGNLLRQRKNSDRLCMRNTLRVLNFFTSLHLTIFEHPAKMIFTAVC